MEYVPRKTTAAHCIASPRFRSTIIYTIRYRYFIRYIQQFILQGNVNSNGSNADGKTNSSSDGNANSWSKASSMPPGGKRSCVIVDTRWSWMGMTRGWGRKCASVMNRSGSGVINYCWGRFVMTVVAMTLRHCRAAKRNAQANHNHCYKKLFHKFCLLCW